MRSVYDLASITKVAATSICLMKLCEEGRLNLDDELKKYMPALDTLELGTRTFREVLAHQSGLYPWIPFYRETLVDSVDHMPVDTMYQRIYDCELRDAGEYRYSDLGYYLIHDMLNSWYGGDKAIDSLSNAWIYEPLGFLSMGFEPLKNLKTKSHRQKTTKFSESRLSEELFMTRSSYAWWSVLSCWSIQ